MAKVERLAVSTHSRPKAAGSCILLVGFTALFQHTAARRRLVPSTPEEIEAAIVSTHSRPKAAGLLQHLPLCFRLFQHTAARRRLGRDAPSLKHHDRFNTQPPEGGWGKTVTVTGRYGVSTHSRPKAAGLRTIRQTMPN